MSDSVDEVDYKDLWLNLDARLRVVARQLDGAERARNGWKASYDNCATDRIDMRKRIAALEAAARAVVDAASFSSNYFPLLCRICAAPDAPHSQSCPVSSLAALLEEGR
jgi:hypothetical protein